LRCFEKSEAWQKLIKTPAGSLTDTTTDKSTSPPTAKDKEPEGKSERKDDFSVDFEGIDGLDLSGLDEIDEIIAAPTDPDKDVAMAGNEDSLFEVVDKPDYKDYNLTSEENEFLLKMGIDYTQPDKLTDSNKRSMERMVGPVPNFKKQDADEWPDIDWETEKKRQLEEEKNIAPGGLEDWIRNS